MADIPVGVIVYLLQLLNFPLPIPQDANSVNSLITNLTALLSQKHLESDLERHPNPSLSASPELYDFIIVGGGTAGAIVANRLSAHEKYKVLLLEAGGDPSILNFVPGLTLFNMHHESNDWLHKTIPLKTYGLSKPNNVATWTRFKGLGGCSVHNWMMHNRGHPKDFDNWADLTGDFEWNYDHLLKYFKRLEDYEGAYPDEKYHGKGGPIHISQNIVGFLPGVQVWEEAAIELGYKVKMDFNSRQEQSFGTTDLTTRKDGGRSDTYTAYIKPILERANLKVIRHAHVHKILLDDSNRATGVVYKRNGELLTVKTSKEIVISGGSINTPQLLMLSGIGPASQLKSIGINPIVDLPGVGQNLQDHAITVVGPFLLNQPISHMSNRDLKMADAEEYVTKGSGYFSVNAVGSTGFISSSIETSQKWSDLQVYQLNIGIEKTATSFLLNQALGLSDGVLETFFESHMNKDANFAGASIGRPKSIGSVTLSSINPEDKPVIDPNYYSHPDDITVKIEGIKFLVNFYENTTAYAKYRSKLVPNKFPGCEEEVFRSDAYWECFMRHTTTTLFHPCGTCKMGKPDDAMAVVDTNLRVLKVKGLRVADASIIPTITNANINTPVMMIAEKAADLILNYHINRDYTHEEL